MVEKYQLACALISTHILYFVPLTDFWQTHPIQIPGSVFDFLEIFVRTNLSAIKINIDNLKQTDIATKKCNIKIRFLERNTFQQRKKQ